MSSTPADVEASATLLGELRRVLGERHVLVDADLRASYETDWSRRWSGASLAVVRPGTTDEVSSALRLCYHFATPVVPQGGRTGLVGGAVPSDGQIALSLERLTDIDVADVLSGQINVGAGVTLAALQSSAASRGWRFGVDLAARESATVGGMISTNAGGIHVVRHGQMREQVVSLEVVLANGDVLRGTGAALKDNAGYDLTQLFIGSEGTLGIVTAARVRLVRPEQSTVVALVGVGDLATAVELVGSLRRRSDTLSAAEFFDATAMNLVGAGGTAAAPVEDSPWYALVECVGENDPTEVLADTLDGAELAESAVAVATDDAGRARLWRLREDVTESIARAGVPHKFDVGLDPARLDEFARVVRSRVGTISPEASVVLFGHLGEGNVHVNVLGLAPEDLMVDDVVLRLVAEMGGNIAAEHGVGRAKAQWLNLSRTPEEIRAMRAIKFALDPTGLLNPGVVLS